jgi:hypothetical protein
MNGPPITALFSSPLPIVDVSPAAGRDRSERHGANLKSGSPAKMAFCHFLRDRPYGLAQPSRHGTCMGGAYDPGAIAMRKVT